MVLITGASGFLGSHLVKYLSSQGISCRALYNAHPPRAELASLQGIEWKQCDLLDIFDVEEVMTGITEIYHCAAIVSFDPRRRNEMLHFNHESTANIVNQALLQGIRKMVHVSSVAALGRTGIDNKEITEQEEWGESRYNSAYAISKYIAEMEVWRAIGEGLNAVIINPGIILGEVDVNSDAAGLMKLANREFPYYTDGVTSWVDVMDVVKIMVALMEADIAAERFIVSGGNYSYRDIFTKMAGVLGKKPPRRKAGRFITGIAWRLSMLNNAFTGSRSVITRETANSATARCIYNNEKLLRALPGLTYTALDKTIEMMARSFINSYKK